MQNKRAQEIISSIESDYLKYGLPVIRVGDTVRVGVRIREGGKERIQPYEGVVIAIRHGGINQTMTVRRIFQGVGVERVFLLHSPKVADIKIVRRGKVRRAKLYYLRNRVGKATRLKEDFRHSNKKQKVDIVKRYSIKDSSKPKIRELERNQESNKSLEKVKFQSLDVRKKFEHIREEPVTPKHTSIRLQGL